MIKVTFKENLNYSRDKNHGKNKNSIEQKRWNEIIKKKQNLLARLRTEVSGLLFS